MSNLRSDCRALVADREPGDVWRTHIERLCHQIYYIEELWHEAVRERNGIVKHFPESPGPIAFWVQPSAMGLAEWQVMGQHGLISRHPTKKDAVLALASHLNTAPQSLPRCERCGVVMPSPWNYCPGGFDGEPCAKQESKP